MLGPGRSSPRWLIPQRLPSATAVAGLEAFEVAGSLPQLLLERGELVVHGLLLGGLLGPSRFTSRFTGLLRSFAGLLGLTRTRAFCLLPRSLSCQA